MKKFFLLSVLAVCVVARGEIRSVARSDESKSKEEEVRTWTTVGGEKTVEGVYSAVSGDMVMIRKADNKLLKVPFSSLSEEDQLYVEYKNPPKMEIEYRNDTDVTQYVAEEWYADNGWGPNENKPIFITTGMFGGEVIQENSKPYNHDLFMEVFVLTEQRYDPSCYHLIAHFKSKPFRLTKENGFRFEHYDGSEYTVLKYDLGDDGLIRGEKLSEFLVLVRDENGEIVGYNGSNKWMYKYLDRLGKLPLNAWLDDKCVRIHPSPIKSGD